MAFGRGEWGGWLAGWVGWVGWLFFGGREGEVLQFLYIQTPDRPLQRLLLVVVKQVSRDACSNISVFRIQEATFGRPPS